MWLLNASTMREYFSKPVCDCGLARRAKVCGAPAAASALLSFAALAALAGLALFLTSSSTGPSFGRSSGVTGS